MNWKVTGKKIWKRTWQMLLVLFLVLCVLEIAYRYQWIDFFKTEFKALNKDTKSGKPNVLVFGDSFTAYPDGYVTHLRKAHSQYNFINCAMPGSGPYEVELMASRRISDYPPEFVIYQMYVGNDLTDINPPVNWRELSFARNTYWSLKGYFQIFGLLSRRLSGLQSDFDPATLKQDSSKFDPKLYSPRTKMMIRADKNYIQKCVNLKGEYLDAMESCKESIEYLRNVLPKKTPIYIVIIPHFSQVTKVYSENYEQLSGHKTSRKTEYPFYRKINGIKGVQALNPMKAFRDAEDNGMQVYFSNDPHLNVEGQRVLFEFLDEKLKKEWK